MLLRLLLLLLLPQKNNSVNDSCSLEVEFSSKNFKNILTWSMPNKNEGVRYNVKYTIYGKDTWWEKAECTNITKNSCDLTNETSPNGEEYYGMVIISNQDCNISKITDRFQPILETILDPPKVHLSSTSTSITINLTHVVKNLSSIYADLNYEITISKVGTNTYKEVNIEIEHLDPQTKYCVSAKLSYLTRSSFSNETCITTKADQTPKERIYVMLYILAVTLFIFTIFGAAYSVHKYVYVGNVKQPQMLNITSNNNNNVVFVNGHNITINIIKIESGESNEQSTMMADKEGKTQAEKKEKTQDKKDLCFTDGGYDASHGSVVTEDDGYVSLLEQLPATRPQVSPYDMPHNLLERPVKPSMAPSVIIKKEDDLYGRIKCNSNIAPIEEKNTVEAHQKSGMSGETFTYLPKTDQHFPKLDVLNHELYEVKEPFIGQEEENIHVTDGTDFSEGDTLFVDWSPTSHHLYIPNFQNKTVEKVGPEKCQEVKGLLTHLYKPIQIEETSEELASLEQRWGLHVKLQE